MHEIKSPFLILMEEQSYLAQSLILKNKMSK